jgi:hypothetical protein
MTRLFALSPFRLFVLSLFCLFSCSTRTPEDPIGSRGTFVPPTSPSIVIENFRAAVSEKNTENYMLCLSDPTTRSRYVYAFEPSAEARARFQSLFGTWSLLKERQSFVSMISRLSADVRPTLTFINSNFSFSSPDSSIFVTDYELVVEHGLTSIPTTLAGTMVLAITPEPSGLWSISRWTDAKRPTDSVEVTWSLLKAQLTN